MTELNPPPKYTINFNNDEIVKNLCINILDKIETELNLGKLKVQIDNRGEIYNSRITEIIQYFNQNILPNSEIKLISIKCLNYTADFNFGLGDYYVNIDTDIEKLNKIIEDKNIIIQMLKHEIVNLEKKNDKCLIL